MIQVGDRILVRSGTGFVKATVAEISGDLIVWEMYYPPGRSKLGGWVKTPDLGLTWTEGWSPESFAVLRFVMATER